MRFSLRPAPPPSEPAWPATNILRLIGDGNDPSFDRITRLATHILGVPVSLVSLVESNRQFFKSAIGLPEPYATTRETPLSHSFCKHVVQTRAPFVVEDARHDALVHDNGAIRDLGVIAYAGMPLITSDDESLGALCAIDTKPRVWSESELATLRDLAAIVVSEIELRAAGRKVRDLVSDLAASERLYRTVARNMPNGALFLVDHDLKYLLAEGDQVLATIGLAPSQIVGHTLSEIVAPENVERVSTLFRRALSGETLDIETQRNGRTLATHIVPVFDDNGVIYAAMLLSYDVTELHRANEQHRTTSAQLTALLQHLQSGVLFEDTELVARLVNPAFFRVLGEPDDPSAILGRTPTERRVRIHSKTVDAAGFARRVTELREGQRVARDDIVPLVDGRVIERDYAPVIDEGKTRGHLWTYRDVTERERTRAQLAAATEELREQSIVDELTGLYNRRGFLSLAERQLKIAERHERTLLLYFVDLNGMKRINDELGHEMGDRALIETAQLLKSAFRETDVVARLGGDEFVVLAIDAASEVNRARLDALLRERNAAPDRPFSLSISVGAALYDPANPKTIDELLAAADTLMYAQKRGRLTSA